MEPQSNHNHSLHPVQSNQVIKQYPDYVVISFILILQFILCGYGLFQKPLWLDEAYSAVMARLSISDIHHAMQYDAGPPLYYDVLHFWRMAFGESEAALRFFSLICSMMATVLVYQFCSPYINQETAIFASLLWAVSPLSVFYAVEARNYTLLAMLMMAYVNMLYTYLQTTKIAYLSIATVILIMLIYTHNTALYFVSAVMMSALCLFRNWTTGIGILLSFTVAGIAFIPWMSTLQHQVKQSELTIGWIQAFWTWMMPLYTFSAFVPGGTTHLYMDMAEFSQPLQWMVYALFGGLLVYSIFHSIVYGNKVLLFVWLLAVLTLSVALLQSVLLKPTYLAGRTDFIVFPLCCIVFGYGVSNIPSFKFKIVFATVTVLFCVTAVGLNYAKPQPVNERELIKTLAYHCNDGDIIVCTGLTRPIVEYAFANQPVTILSYPSDMQEHLAHLNEAWYLQNMDAAADARHVMTQAVQKKAEQSKIIVLWSGRAVNQPLQTVLNSTEFTHLAKNEYIHPQIGLSRLNEPIALWIYQ